MKMIWVEQMVAKHGENNFDRKTPPVNKIPVEQIRVLRRGVAIDGKDI